MYGFPGHIHTDQGANFESELVAELLRLSGVSKWHTTAYQPMGNGGTERFNRILGNMLRLLPLREKVKWPQQIQTLTFSIVYLLSLHMLQSNRATKFSVTFRPRNIEDSVGRQDGETVRR